MIHFPSLLSHASLGRAPYQDRFAEFLEQLRTLRLVERRLRGVTEVHCEIERAIRSEHLANPGVRLPHIADQLFFLSISGALVFGPSGTAKLANRGIEFFVIVHLSG